MRSRGNVLGPGNRANATIGRAIRLLLINLAGAAGDLDKACVGHPGKYSYCVAEDEDEAWPPLTKKAINFAEDEMGLRAAMDYSFALHQLAHASSAETSGSAIMGVTPESMRKSGG